MLYFFFYTLFSPVFFIVLVLISFFNRKIRLHLWSGPKSLKRAVEILSAYGGDKIVVVFHAASAGEFEQLKPVLEAMDRKKYYLVQTFFSPTIYQKACDSDLFDVCLYHPFDFPWSARNFFKKLHPAYYILTRHDIWPQHLHTARRMGIRTVLINANLHEKSRRLHPWLKPFNYWLFDHFDLITTGSRRINARLSQFCTGKKAFVTGDTRFDQVIRRSQLDKPDLLPKTFSKTKNMIFGSIIPSDHPLIFGALENAYPEGTKSLESRNQRLILVPHEVHETDLLVIEGKLSELNFAAVRYSKLMSESETQVVIVDKVGILPDLYRYARLAYVGASFGGGVHSVVEPAVYGTVVSFGPKIHILDEAITMYEQGIGRMVKTPEELTAFITLLGDDSAVSELSQMTRKFVLDRSNTIPYLLQLIFKEAN